MAVEHLWGTSFSNMYFVGLNGSIVHYDESGFTQMESLPGQGGTDVDLTDIDGTPDGEHVFVVGITNVNWWGNLILEYSNGGWHTLYESDHYLPDEDDYGSVLNVSVLGVTAYITMMGGIWKYNYIESTSLYIPVDAYNEGAYFHTTHIKALEVNDVFLVSTR